MSMTHERNKELLLDALDYLYELRAEWSWKKNHPCYEDQIISIDKLILDIEKATDE